MVTKAKFSQALLRTRADTRLFIWGVTSYEYNHFRVSLSPYKASLVLSIKRKTATQSQLQQPILHTYEFRNSNFFPLYIHDFPRVSFLYTNMNREQSGKYIQESIPCQHGERGIQLLQYPVVVGGGVSQCLSNCLTASLHSQINRSLNLSCSSCSGTLPPHISSLTAISLAYLWIRPLEYHVNTTASLDNTWLKNGSRISE